MQSRLVESVRMIGRVRNLASASIVLGLGAWFCLMAVSRADADAQLRVVTSIAPIYSWVANIVGNSAKVENLLPAGTGPHDYQLRPGDVEKLRSADMLVINGLGLESSLERSIKSHANASKCRIIRTSDGFESQWIRGLPMLTTGTPEKAKSNLQVRPHDDRPGRDREEEPNPHLWLDPQFAQFTVSNLVVQLSLLDPTHAPDFQLNGENYLGRLRALDSEIESASKTWTFRKIVTFHDAFPYFIRRYKLELVGVIEEVPSVSPSARYLSKLSKVIRQTYVSVLFVEPQFSPIIAERLAEDLKLKIATLDVLETGELTPNFYIDRMRNNLEVLNHHLR